MFFNNKEKYPDRIDDVTELLMQAKTEIKRIQGGLNNTYEYARLIDDRLRDFHDNANNRLERLEYRAGIQICDKCKCETKVGQ